MHYRFFKGPNRYTLTSAAEVLVDLGPLANRASTEQEGFITRLLQSLPGIARHHCSRGHAGGFVERLNEGTYLGHVAEHVALELLFLGGERGVYGKTRHAFGDTVRVIFETETELGGGDAIATAIRLVEGMWNGEEERWISQIAQFADRLAEVRLGPSTMAICRAARRRNIPVERLDGDNLVRLGQGVRQHRVMATTSDRTAVTAIEIAQDKMLTKSILQRQGIVVPPGAVASNAAEAAAWAQRWGFPVVIKPLAGHHGQGVATHLANPAEVSRAFDFARSFGGPVLVEKEVPGNTYRLLVVGRRLVAASERIAPAVVGDGVHTLSELVEALNRDPRRGRGHAKSMTRVEIDGPALMFLSQQGMVPTSVPPLGQRVGLRSSANMSTGAVARDVTDRVSPALAFDAVRAAQAVGLDIAGVDVVTSDLAASLKDVGGAVIEVNAAPGLRMHLDPAEGKAQPVAEAIVDNLFGPANDGRIPVAAVTGTNGKTTVARMIGHILSRQQRIVGMATTDGITVGEVTVCEGDLTGPWSARLVLNDPTVEAAVLETARGGMILGGLGFDDCDVAVVTNIGSDHLGQDGIDTIEDLVHLKSLLIDVVRPQGAAVLNADDPWVMSMAVRSRGKIVLFSGREDSPTIGRHTAQGGDAVYVKRGNLVFTQAGRNFRLVGTRVLPASLGGMATMNVANAAAAAAAALAMGVPVRHVAKALASFPAGGEGMNRGRLEMLSGDDLKVLIDYGHNQPAMAELAALCRRLKARPVITVLGLPGDRRDQDLIETAGQVAVFSQRVVVREDHDLRGRRPGEAAELIRCGLIGAQMDPAAIEVELDEGAAVRRAILTSPPDALVLILYEQYRTVRDACQDAMNLRHHRQMRQEIHASG